MELIENIGSYGVKKYLSFLKSSVGRQVFRTHKTVKTKRLPMGASFNHMELLWYLNIRVVFQGTF
jgi:hypothetical protein